MSDQADLMVQGVEEAIAYQFNDPTILWEALQAAGSSVFIINGRRLIDGNKRLALLGDAILKVALVEDWYSGVEPRGGSQT